MYTDVPTGYAAQQDEAFQKPVIAGFAGNSRCRFDPLTDVHGICHALRERTYLWRKPKITTSPALYDNFVSETLAGIRQLAHCDDGGQAAP